MSISSVAVAVKWRVRQSRWWFLIGGCLLVLAVAAGVYFLQIRHTQKFGKAYNPFQEQVTRLTNQTPPTEPEPRAIYYGQIAQNYEQSGEWRQALAYYLKAQMVIDTAGANDQYAFYQPIASAYTQLGDKVHAKQYLQLQLAYLQTYSREHPDDDATTTAIQTVERQIRSL